MHCRKRQMGGNVEKNPNTRELLELHSAISAGFQSFEYRQKNNGMLAKE